MKKDNRQIFVSVSYIILNLFFKKKIKISRKKLVGIQEAKNLI
jgi:hypothetical protein